ncbi:long-chain-fatty-acid--CoA ligase 2 [Trichomonascus vanleenenianus]|uniref:medium-chain fatty acid-CoA ligase FAA2 n=1 Tax=Trichomonascus vanleenenianus TaxID=2268995 RepID=UPI003ECB6E79
MTTNTSTRDFKFSDDVAKRLGNYPLTTLDGVDESSDILDSSPQLCHVPLGEVQAIPISGTKTEGYSEVYRNVKSPNKLVSTYHPHISTVYEAFEKILEYCPGRDCLGERKYDESIKDWAKNYSWLSYAEVAQRRNNFGSGIVHVVEKHANLTPRDRNYIVAVYGPNCINWVVADLACQTQNLPTVCLYDTLGPDTSEYILNFCESPVVVVSLANLPKILRLAPKLPHLKAVVSLDPLKSSREFEAPGHTKKELLSEWAAELGLGLYTMDEVELWGIEKPLAHNPPTRDDIYAINFTSGTTGNPKGAILTHANVIAGITQVRANLSHISAHKNLTGYSFLPLAHIYERITLCSSLVSGVRQGYPHGPLTEILDDIAVIKPHGVTMVPRVLNRIATSLKAATIEAPGLAGALSRRALQAKLDHLHKTGSYSHPFWDRVWSNKIRKKLGFENLQYLVTGSAPLSKENIEFLKVALGTELNQGYGLTESLSGICVTQPLDRETGSCGPIGVACEVRLRDVPDYGYTSDDKPEPRGEIMLRGPQIFAGYYQNNEKTDEAFDKDGWFHTGDVGKIDKYGRIHIIDRVKNFFKLAQGEYIGAEKIENAYTARCSMVAQIFVTGVSTETFLVSVVGINPDTYAPWVSKILGKQIAAADLLGLSETFKDKKVRRAFLKALNDSVEPGVLHGFERVKNVRLAIEPLNQDNETVTPTLKIKRNVADKVFKEEVEEMYREGEQYSANAAKL